MTLSLDTLAQYATELRTGPTQVPTEQADDIIDALQGYAPDMMGVHRLEDSADGTTIAMDEVNA